MTEQHRIRQLAVIGLSSEAIRRVIELDYGHRPKLSAVREEARRVDPARRFLAGLRG